MTTQQLVENAQFFLHRHIFLEGRRRIKLYIKNYLVIKGEHLYFLQLVFLPDFMFVDVEI